MSSLNPYQQYSQGENVVTNNVLLMLSSVYDINPKYYNELIGRLTEDSSYSVVPEFNQQRGNQGNGIIDAHIKIRSSSIIIETKLWSLENFDKLIKYTDSFKENEEVKILMHLSRERYSQPQIETINRMLLDKNPKAGVRFYSITYNQIADELHAIAEMYFYDVPFKKLTEQFCDYCTDSGFMVPKHILRAMACGQSFDMNIKYQFYFDLASRNFSAFNYLGIYYWKSVRFIGAIDNIIVADLDYDNDKLIVYDEKFPVTPEQEQKLLNAMKEADSQGWGISEGHRFFLLKEFCETDFRKTSPGGIFRVRYFNLEEEKYLGKNMPDDLLEIAEGLKHTHWD